MKPDLFIFAGERSGDVHGAKLIKALKEQDPTLNISGVGGPEMRKEEFKSLIDMEEFQVMGFVDIVGSFPKLFNLFHLVKRLILERRPKAVIFIDYPGFNLRMARSLKKAQAPSKIIQYISPSVWAWGKKRIPFMEKYCDMLLTILPFEKELFNGNRLDVRYVGHPLIETLEKKSLENWGLTTSSPILALFPGSRQKEIERNLPIQVLVGKEIASKKGMSLAISCADKNLEPLIEKWGESIPIIAPDKTHELMDNTHMAIATSGTVTLELALKKIPTTVTFAIHPLDLFLAQKVFRIRLPHYSLPNIISQEEIFPELFGPNFTDDLLYEAVEYTLARRGKIQKQCAALKEKLGNHNASTQAASAIREISGY